MSVQLDSSAIAVIGMAGRFPGARNIEEYWRNLCEAAESISHFTDEELILRGVSADLARSEGYVKSAAIIENVDLFDAPFFNMSFKEAEVTDPQHRLFLECAWEALESAGYDSENYPGAIGVFGGVTINTYLLCNLASNPELLASLDPVQLNIGNGGDFLTTRVSYKLNLKGPSHLVQCACSTSLVAIHIACQNLLNEECDIALAGGASVNVRQQAGYQYLPGGMQSPDGHCRPFDAKAQGTIFGSGVGIVVLKRLEEAIADGDHIFAVIKGSAINNDGAFKVGYTAPSVEGQAEVITEALANSGVTADSIGYIEAHGTATPLGDPIEAAALTKAFRQSTPARNFCGLGSVKSNIGHLDAAAGVAGLIKTALALYHKRLPPSLNYEQPNPQIDFAESPFYVNTKLKEWVRGEEPRRAGVSSFGVGGTNAHVILEEAPALEDSAGSREWKALMLSAKSEKALEAATMNLMQYLRERPDALIEDVAYTLQTGRRTFNHRRVLVCRNAGEALDAALSGALSRTHLLSSDSIPETSFMFPGQGTQYVGMGSELYKKEKAFRDSIDRYAEALLKEQPEDLRDVLYPKESRRTAAEQKMEQTSVAQHALFATEYALSQLWISWDVTPKSMIGHSIGEYVAACLAGVFTLEDVSRLLSVRGKLMHSLPPGAMIAVPMTETEVSRWLQKGQSISAVNGPTQCIVSGDEYSISQLEQSLRNGETIPRRLRVSRAFHSTMLDPIIDDFVDAVKTMALNPPRIPFVSNVTGTWISAQEAIDPNYWGKHLRNTVRFADGFRTIIADSKIVLLEVGPGRTLSQLSMKQSMASPPMAIASLDPGAGALSEQASLLLSLGRLWLAGVRIDWKKFYGEEKRRRLPLPTYPFEKRRCWVEPKTSSRVVHNPIDTNPDIGTPIDEGRHHSISQQRKESLEDDHIPHDERVHPRPLTLPTAFIPPASGSEQAIAQIWQRALGVKPIGVDDNFFDLGGDSLIALKVIEDLKKEFKQEVSPVSLYEGTTIRSLAKILRVDETPAAQEEKTEKPASELAERARLRKQYQRGQRAQKKTVGHDR